MLLSKPDFIDLEIAPFVGDYTENYDLEGVFEYLYARDIIIYKDGYVSGYSWNGYKLEIIDALTDACQANEK